MAGEDLETAIVEVAERLYGAAPDGFVAARDAEVRTARDAGDRALAGEIKQLRKPSVGAWLLNTTVRSDPDSIGALLDLGAALREAQQAGDGTALRSMTPRRRQVVRDLTARATRLAADAGHPLSSAALREIESTLEAALADEDAGDAIRTGRLVRALTSTGLEPVDLSGAVAVPQALPPARTLRAVPDLEPAASPKARQKQPSKRAVTAARSKLDSADEELRRQDDLLRSTRDEVSRARAEVDRADAALRAAQQAHADAESARRDADAARRLAHRRRDIAARALREAERG